MDLNKDPNLFFALNGPIIMSEGTHNILIDCMKAKRMEEETVNFVDPRGFTPFLFYIFEFLSNQQRAKASIQKLLRAGVVPTNETIME